ncbi:L-lactate permease [Pseudothermotoga sp. U03pept]|uniref:L-lactate permease n=1 Tax=Pseudothermotoga sp. U03pept TaxID=3447012 RepID=UPI003F056E3E
MNGLIAFLPVFVILVMLLVGKSSVGRAGFLGLLTTLILSGTYFHTPLEVICRSVLAGLVASLPVSVIVVASLLQLSIMEVSGAMKRIISFSRQLCCKDEVSQFLTLVIGFGTVLSAAGAVPVTVITPILVAMGYSSVMSISLSALGYDSLCTYTILGVPLVVFSDIVGVDLIFAAKHFVPFISVVSFSISVAVLYIAGGLKYIKRGFVPSLMIGLLSFLGAELAIFLKAPIITGLIAGFLIIAVLLILYRLRNGKDLMVSPKDEMSLIKAFMPWLILIFFIVCINLFEPLRNLFYKTLSVPIDLLKGRPVYTRPFWQAYTWIFASGVISLFIYRLNNQQLREIFRKTKKRVAQPFWSATVFFLIAYVMMNSGFEKTQNGFELLRVENNMIHAMAVFSAKLFKDFYPFFTPYLGVLGGFVTGTQTSATAMFANYTMETSKLLGFSPIFMTAAVAFGSGLASAISPSKLQNAAASIDRIGEEKKVFPKTILIVLLMALFTSVISYSVRKYSL